VGKLHQWVPIPLVDTILKCLVPTDSSQEEVMSWNTGSYAPFSISRAYDALSPLPIQPISIAKVI